MKLWALFLVAAFAGLFCFTVLAETIAAFVRGDDAAMGWSFIAAFVGFLVAAGLAFRWFPLR